MSIVLGPSLWPSYSPAGGEFRGMGSRHSWCLESRVVDKDHSGALRIGGPLIRCTRSASPLILLAEDPSGTMTLKLSL
jgi:hypothetical protein